MMRPIYHESNLVFRFPSHWGIRQYDKQRFYLQMSGQGLKGVDFLAIDPIGEGHLYLIEVKNYRTRNHEGGTFVSSLKPAPELAATVAAKYEHTVRAINAIQLYYRRKWWYRLLQKHYLISRNFERDPVFWKAAHRLAQNSSKHTMLLWLETENADEYYDRALEMTLEYELLKGAKFVIASSTEPYPVGIVVTKERPAENKL